MAKIKFNISFKKETFSGRMAIGNPFPNSTIKVNKKVVGCINAPNWRSEDNLWRVLLHIQKDDSFKNVFLKQTFSSDDEARNYLREHLEKLNENYPLALLED